MPAKFPKIQAAALSNWSLSRLFNERARARTRERETDGLNLLSLVIHFARFSVRAAIRPFSPSSFSSFLFRLPAIHLNNAF